MLAVWSHSNNSVSEIHLICLERERDRTSRPKDKHPTRMKPHDRKVDIQDRAKDPTIHKWGWSDLIDMAPKPSHNTQGTSRNKNDSYAKLR